MDDVGSYSFRFHIPGRGQLALLDAFGFPDLDAFLDAFLMAFHVLVVPDGLIDIILIERLLVGDLVRLREVRDRRQVRQTLEYLSF